MSYNDARLAAAEHYNVHPEDVTPGMFHRFVVQRHFGVLHLSHRQFAIWTESNPEAGQYNPVFDEEFSA